MKITLTPQQKLQLEEMHDSTRDGRVRDRIKAVLLASEGWSQEMISQALRIHESTVARHLSDYVLSEKLKPENGGSQSKLSATQTMHLIEHLTEKTYFHMHISEHSDQSFRDYPITHFGLNRSLIPRLSDHF
ncbi:DNA-binding protein [Vibrio cholerae]|nr:DNA-binding protein [Vibrio cholerae]